MRTDEPQGWSEPIDELARTLERALRELAPRADAVFVREPLVDPDAPRTSDIDLLAVGDVDALRPERLRFEDPRAPTRPVDVIWIPRRDWQQAPALAVNGVIPHRILASRLVHDGGDAGARVDTLRSAVSDPSLQAVRIQGFLAMGHLTVREIGITWDFPALALFWLHMACAALVAAVADALGLWCPNVYTRPMEYVRRVAPSMGAGLEATLVRALRLDVDPLPLVAPLRRIHRVVVARLPEPEWPATMRSTTRHEYRYFADPRELEWRIAVAGELAARGEQAAAVFHLRCWAYFVACLALVHRRAVEGLDVSFVRPARAVKPDLGTWCPDILDDLAFVLGSTVTVDDVRASLDTVLALRARALAAVGARGVRLGAMPAWEPFGPPPGAG